jgi:hypothetical protein
MIHRAAQSTAAYNAVIVRLFSAFLRRYALALRAIRAAISHGN